jgi:endonuclease/exonuclease/phosphatase family metal-dependent hydrolase
MVDHGRQMPPIDIHQRLMCKRTYQLILCIFTLLFLNNPALSEPLRLSTWNLEWLTSGQVTRVARNQQDIRVLAQEFKRLQPDVLFFQEVNDKHAITQIVGHQYQVIFSDRAENAQKQHQFATINQYTGLALKKGLKYDDPQDIQLTPYSKLRYATYIVLKQSNQPIHLLSVHLKSGCFGRLKRGKKSCQQLQQQAHVLNQWLLQRERRHEAYIIAGDFNHHLADPQDWFWQQMTRQLKAPPRLATRETQSKCHVRSAKNSAHIYQYRKLIDHIVISPSLTSSSLNRSATNKMTAWQTDYKPAALRHHRLSDHCPISVTLH